MLDVVYDYGDIAGSRTQFDIPQDDIEEQIALAPWTRRSCQGRRVMIDSGRYSDAVVFPMEGKPIFSCARWSQIEFKPGDASGCPRMSIRFALTTFFGLMRRSVPR